MQCFGSFPAKTPVPSKEIKTLFITCRHCLALFLALLYHNTCSHWQAKQRKQEVEAWDSLQTRWCVANWSKCQVKATKIFIGIFSRLRCLHISVIAGRSAYSTCFNVNIASSDYDLILIGMRINCCLCGNDLHGIGLLLEHCWECKCSLCEIAARGR